MTKTDVVIIGAGPVGLFAIFELGLQGLKTHVVEALAQAGGQCSELYPTKPIYDIPAVPVCTGQQLTDLLLQQVTPFNPTFHYDQEVIELEKRGEHDFYLKTSKGLELECRAVIVAAGGGSFTPVKVKVEGLDQFLDSQLFYRVRDPAHHAGKDIVILGGGDSALDWALELAPLAKSLTVVNRTERFRASEASVNQLRAMEADGKVSILLGMSTAFREVDGSLTEVQFTLRDEAKTQVWLPVEHLLVFFGMSPKIGAIENWGLDLERKHIVIDQSTFESSTPGIYAIGDINTYPGKKKLILSGFHEAAMSAYAISQSFNPDKKIPVQYTTTSSVMQDRLGVES
ncbi:MAG: NAD(P)/FAD-dependent oxidoreductase [Gammaproteobacteria bacterium]|nr:NAD(P)/FAD-dependent oxidoreductase [Gammaproteobacteria bacterium]